MLFGRYRALPRPNAETGETMIAIFGAVEILRTAGPVVLALAGGLILDRRMTARGFVPPGFANPWRRGLAGALVTVAFYLGIFAPLGLVGGEPVLDPSALQVSDLFLLHGFFALVLLAWFLLGFGGTTRKSGWVFLRQFGLSAPDLGRELGLGAVLGVLGWLLVMGVLLAVGILVWVLGLEEALPGEPPAMVIWIAGLPVAARLGASVSAGLVEEVFFRGFLQPRIGIPLSTLLFVLAHLTYEQPFLLVGVTVLSLIFAYTVRWRQNIWAAVTAHAAFDALQLLVVIPKALEYLT